MSVVIIVASRPLVDPQTKDYVMAGGRLTDDPTHRTTILFLIRLQRGSSAAMPDRGSRYHEIDRITKQTLKQIEDMTREALAPLIVPRKITATEIVATRGPAPGVVELRVDWLDDGGQPNSLTEYLSIGGQSRSS